MATHEPLEEHEAIDRALTGLEGAVDRLEAAVSGLVQSEQDGEVTR